MNKRITRIPRSLEFHQFCDPLITIHFINIASRIPTIDTMRIAKLSRTFCAVRRQVTVVYFEREEIGQGLMEVSRGSDMFRGVKVDTTMIRLTMII